MEMEAEGRRGGARRVGRFWSASGVVRPTEGKGKEERRRRGSGGVAVVFFVTGCHITHMTRSITGVWDMHPYVSAPILEGNVLENPFSFFYVSDFWRKFKHGTTSAEKKFSKNTMLEMQK
jgi:hypothetical protein